MTRYLLLVFALHLLIGRCDPASADIITFDLLDPAGTPETAGEALEGGTPFTSSGITLSVGVQTTLGDGTAVYSANTTAAGVNSNGITTGDAASGIDAGETVNFTLVFSNLIVLLQNLDLSGVGTTTDRAEISINGGAQTLLFTGQSNFDGSIDLWTPPNLSLSSGDTISVSTNGTIELQALTLNATGVPEPSSFAVLGVIGMILFAHHRRRQNVMVA